MTLLKNEVIKERIFRKLLQYKLIRKDVIVEFTDNGIRIPQKELENIFYTTKGLDRGTGLGLSVSKKMRASITAKSIPNEFTTFTIKFHTL